MKQDLSRVYSGANLSGATAGVIYLPIVRDSTLEKVSVRTNAAQSGAAVFEVRKNNVVIAGLAALTIANGAKIGSATGLNIALVDGDEITLDLVSGSVSSPLTLNLEVDDGESGGTSLPAGDLNAATNKIEQIQGKPISFPATGSGLSDQFNTLDPAKFSVVAGAASIVAGALRLETTAQNNNVIVKTLEDFDFNNSEIAIELDNKTVEMFIFGFAKNADCTVGNIFGNARFIGMANETSQANYYRHTYGRFVYTGDESYFSDTQSSVAETRRFRIRTNNGIFYYDTATPDGEWIQIGVFDYSAASLTGLRFFMAAQKSASATVDIKYLQSNLGAPPTMLMKLNPDNTISAITLADLKAALAALP